MIAAEKLEAKTADAAPDQPRRMITEEELLKLVPLSRTTLYRLIKGGSFPKGRYVSANRRLWFADEVVAWQAEVDQFNPNRGRGKGRRPRQRVSPSST
jgi:predicted DNA-binding transcriptional regulator AlpA